MVEFNLRGGKFVNFKQWFLDTSLQSLYNLSSTTATSFPTPLGAQVKKQIQTYWDALDLGSLQLPAPALIVLDLLCLPTIRSCIRLLTNLL